MDPQIALSFVGGGQVECAIGQNDGEARLLGDIAGRGGFEHVGGFACGYVDRPHDVFVIVVLETRVVDHLRTSHDILGF
jgi:hypothetical protein